jgi:two-component system chemotaxis response regulator CheY
LCLFLGISVLRPAISYIRADHFNGGGSEAANGEDGLKELAIKPAHLVISDFNMPKLDGLGFLKAVRANTATANTGFIMLTGRADTELVGRARQFGVNNYVVKPFTTAQLKEKIEQVFGALT